MVIQSSASNILIKELLPHSVVYSAPIIIPALDICSFSHKVLPYEVQLKYMILEFCQRNNTDVLYHYIASFYNYLILDNHYLLFFNPRIIMDITRHNFKELFDYVERAISDANFIAIDGEFTGITNATFNLTNYDSPEERYHKLRHNVSDFLLMQFGLVTFKWNAEKEEYISEAFNFYIFPFRSTSSGVPDRIFACQSSSIDFLTAQKFDFNKVFHSGIPYLRQGEEASMRAALSEKHALRMQNFKSPRKSLDNNGAPSDSVSPAGSPTMITDPRTQAFLDGVKEKIQQFLSSSNEDCLELEPCNSYLRKILYETVPTMFPEPLVLEAKVNEKTRQRYLVVQRAGSEEEIQRKTEAAKAKDDSVLQDAVGFSRIIQVLARCQKLIVGHNMLLDILYTIQQFIRPLPQGLDELKAILSCTFPRIVDTKLMGNMLPFREVIPSTALGDLHTRLSQPPFIVPDIIPPAKYDPAKSDHDMHDNLHEAAYDAYITGVSFLTMLNFLGSFRQKGNSKAIANPSSDIISPYINKVFLMRSPEIPYLNLAGSDLSPPRSHVFHLQFPTNWRASDVRTLFSPVASAINISWINDTQCFVGLYDKTQAKQVKKFLIKPGGLETNPYVIRTYEEYQREMACQMYTPPVFRPNFNLTPYSKNRVWRPNNGGSTGNVTSYAQAAATNVTGSNVETPKSTAMNRKRSGEEAAVGKPASVRRISSTSNRIDNLDLDEPDVKRQRSVQSNEPMSESISSSIARTDIPSLLVSSANAQDEDVAKLPTQKPPISFEVPSNWG